MNSCPQNRGNDGKHSDASMPAGVEVGHPGDRLVAPGAQVLVALGEVDQVALARPSANRRPPSSASALRLPANCQTTLPSTSTVCGQTSAATSPAGGWSTRRAARPRGRRPRSSVGAELVHGVLLRREDRRPRKAKRCRGGWRSRSVGRERRREVEGVEHVARRLGEERCVGADDHPLGAGEVEQRTAAHRACRSACRTTCARTASSGVPRRSPQNAAMRGRCSGSVPPPWLAPRRRPGLAASVPLAMTAAMQRADLGRKFTAAAIGGSSHAAPVRRVERVHEHAQAEAGRRLEERARTRGAPVLVPLTFEPICDAGEAERADLVQRVDRGVEVLQRHGAEPGEPVRRARRPCSAIASFKRPAERPARRGLGPVAEQLGHHRQHLHRDAVPVHLERARRSDPTPARLTVRNSAAADEHVAAVAVDATAGEAARRARTAARRHDVRVHVDRSRRRLARCPHADRQRRIVKQVVVNLLILRYVRASTVRSRKGNPWPSSALSDPDFLVDPYPAITEHRHRGIVPNPDQGGWWVLDSDAIWQLIRDPKLGERPGARRPRTPRSPGCSSSAGCRCSTWTRPTTPGCAAR